MKKIFSVLFFLITYYSWGQVSKNNVRDHYQKLDTTIQMRDGVKLYTVIYIPRDDKEKYPFLIERTPYSAGPYGDTTYPNRLPASQALVQEKYIFVYQDVRGRYMSEGSFTEVTPHTNGKKNKATDESSDTYDTVDWLVKNIRNNNGRAGITGISYPGFYATASLPGAHPALKAASPQAPISDEFMGDDVNHNGAFFLLDNFNFMNYFDKKRPGPVKDYGGQVFNVNYPDAYAFFLKMGPLRNTRTEKYFQTSPIWNEYLQHDTYDDYWQIRNVRKHLKNIKIPVLIVGGWFDAEDLFGALETYKSIEKQSPQNNTKLVMGPWTHGTWAANDWSRFAGQEFGNNTSKYFQDSLETTFFNYYLKDKGSFDAAETTVFETGSNTWKKYDVWPPAGVQHVSYYLNQGGALTLLKNTLASSFDEYISDPNKPVPYTNGIFPRRNNEYMAEDQRFAATRPDVLVYETDILADDVSLSGKILADLFISTSSTDVDLIVKLIDVLPDSAMNNRSNQRGVQTAGMQRLIRAEVMRGKFRNSFEKPEAFTPGKISQVTFSLNDVAHTFKKGHKIMIHVQSSWFPLVDRNPQKFMRIPEAVEHDFQKATIKIHHDLKNISRIVLPVLSK